mgnify:CR=1 FL=1
MINEKAKEIITKYDRSIVAIIVGIGMIVTFYLTVHDKFNNLVASTSVIRDIQISGKLQEEKNKKFEGDIENIKKRGERFETKLDSFFSEMRSAILVRRTNGGSNR